MNLDNIKYDYWGQINKTGSSGLPNGAKSGVVSFKTYYKSGSNVNGVQTYFDGINTYQRLLWDSNWDGDWKQVGFGVTDAAELASVVAGIINPYKNHAPISADVDFNTITEHGVYCFQAVNGIGSNHRPTRFAGAMLVSGYAASRVFQVFFCAQDGKIYLRMFDPIAGVGDWISCN